MRRRWRESESEHFSRVSGSMFRVFLGVHVITQVLSAVPPPQDIRVANWSLTWTSNTQDKEVFYTVQFLSATENAWEGVPTCVKTPVKLCNIPYSQIQADHGCVRLCVKAEKHGLTSECVETCSSHGDPCVPPFSLDARPGTLTVHLSREQGLQGELCDIILHRIYFGKKGEPLKEKADSETSLTFKELDMGQHYCVKVQYLEFKTVLGPPSSAQCQLIPFPGIRWITALLVTAVVLVLLVSGMAYVFLFHRNKIKHWLQPSCEIPEMFLETVPEYHLLVVSSGNEECDVVSVRGPGRPSEE